jgi:hypothetical protein
MARCTTRNYLVEAAVEAADEGAFLTLVEVRRAGVEVELPGGWTSDNPSANGVEVAALADSSRCDRSEGMHASEIDQATGIVAQQQQQDTPSSTPRGADTSGSAQLQIAPFRRAARTFRCQPIRKR